MSDGKIVSMSRRSFRTGGGIASAIPNRCIASTSMRERRAARRRMGVLALPLAVRWDGHDRSGIFDRDLNKRNYCPTMGVKPSPSGENFS